MEDDYALKLLKQIEDLEEQIKKINYTNFKNKSILTLHKNLLKAKKGIIYALVTGIVFTSFSVGLSIPFYNDPKKRNLWLKKEYDSNGNKTIEEQFIKYNNKNEISVYSKWQKYNNEYYVRDITIYSLESLTEEEVLNQIENDNFNINKILKDPILIKREKKNNLTEEEKNNPGYLKVTIYDKENNTAVIKETSLENITFTVFWAMVTIAALGLSAAIMYDPENQKLNAKLKDLEEKYPLLEIEDLEKKLKIRKDSYNRIR